MVRATVDAPPVAWAPETDLEYGTLAWAGDRLIAQRTHGNPFIDQLAVFDGAGKMRILGAAAQPPGGGASAGATELVAVSPDQKRALLVRTVDDAGHLYERAFVANLVDGTRGPDLELMSAGLSGLNAGSWQGDQVVTSEGISPDGAVHGPPPRVVVLDLSGSAPAVERTARFRDVGSGPFNTVGALSFSDDTQTRVRGWFTRMPSTSQYIECDLIALHCDGSDPVQMAGPAS